MQILLQESTIIVALPSILPTVTTQRKSTCTVCMSAALHMRIKSINHPTLERSILNNCWNLF